MLFMYRTKQRSEYMQNSYKQISISSMLNNWEQEGLAVASIARDDVVEMTPPRDDNAR